VRITTRRRLELYPVDEGERPPLVRRHTASCDSVKETAALLGNDGVVVTPDVSESLPSMEVKDASPAVIKGSLVEG